MPQNKSEIVKKPWITEKSARLSKQGKYVFVVAKDAKSNQIEEAIQRIYGVHVLKTNIVNVPSHTNQGSRRSTRKGEYKKAIVTLKAGEKIDIIPQ